MSFTEFILENWHVRLVSLILIYAAFIDGRDLKVPNWITFPMVFSGLVFSLGLLMVVAILFQPKGLVGVYDGLRARRASSASGERK